MNYVFIGGLKRGYLLLKALLEDGRVPTMCFFLVEDSHEIEKHSDDLLDLIDGKCPAFLRKKLSGEDYKAIQGNYDFAIVCGWRTMIRLDKIDHWFKYGIFAAHDRLLPKYRGVAPTVWAVMNGESKAGVTIFKIDENEVDSGPVYFQEEVEISALDDVNTVMDKVIKGTIEGFRWLFENIDNCTPRKQIEKNASYTCKRNPEDGRVDWKDDSNNIWNLGRALVFPYPGAFFFHQEKKIVIRKIKLGNSDSKIFSGRIPGKIIDVSGKGIEVMCGQGSVQLDEVEFENVVYPAADLFKSINITLK